MKTIETTVGTCGVCEREIAIQDGRLVHHGYKRPGYGHIVGDCFAVGYEPYERSTAASVAYQTMWQKQLPVLQARLADLEEGRVTYLRKVYPSGRRGVIVVEHAVGVSDCWKWEDALRNAINEARYAVKGCEAEIARMQRLIDGFEPRELGTETRAGQKTREEKEARDAERAAKRAVKTEKARVLAEKKAIKEQKATALRAKYREELERVLEKHEAIDSLGSPSVKFEAMDVLARMEKECKKTPKVSFYARSDLGEAAGWEELFLKLGLAVRESNGWVRYDVFNIG